MANHRQDHKIFGKQKQKLIDQRQGRSHYSFFIYFFFIFFTEDNLVPLSLEGSNIIYRMMFEQE